MVPDPVVGVLTPAARRTGGCGHQIVNHFKVGSRRFRRIGAAVRRLQTIGPSQAVIWRRLARRNHNGWTKKSWSDTGRQAMAEHLAGACGGALRQAHGEAPSGRRSGGTQQRPGRGRPKARGEAPCRLSPTVKAVDGRRPPGGRPGSHGLSRPARDRPRARPTWAGPGQGRPGGAALPSAGAGEARDPCRLQGVLGRIHPGTAPPSPMLHNPAKCLELF